MLRNLFLRPINDGNVDLNKFPASKVRQLVKRMESLKATAHHIKQVSCDPQAAHVNLLMHQCTELSAGKYKKSFAKSKQTTSSLVMRILKCQASTRNGLMSRIPTRTKIGVEGFQCLAKMFQGKACHKFGHFTSLCYQKKTSPFQVKKAKGISITSRGSICQRKCHMQSIQR